MKKNVKILLSLFMFSMMLITSLYVVESYSYSSFSDLNEKGNSMVENEVFSEKTGSILQSNVSANKNIRKNPINLLGSTWSGKPGGWWDTDWEYRVNVTLTENASIDRVDWPVDVYIEFAPPAFKYSIRIIKVDDSTYTEVPYQPWNITYTDDSKQYIKSATITFPATVAAYSSALYQVYWSVTYKDLPTYTRNIAVKTDTGFYGTIYTLTSLLGWKAVIPPENGGRVMNITLPNGETIGHNWIQFGVTKDPTLSYEGYTGVADTSNIQYSDRYIEEERDELMKNFEGVVFVTYVVEGVPILDQSLSTVALVDYKLRMYRWGIIASETIYNIDPASGSGTYYLGGWVFDQDDSGPATFDYALLNSLEVEVERSLLYGIGSTSAEFNKFKVYSGTGNPYYVVLRPYLAAGSYTLTVSDVNNPGNVYGDDPWAKIFDTSGSLLVEGYDINSLSLSFTADSNGYYYVIIGAWDDDSPTGYNQGDGVASFNVNVGAFSTTVSLAAVNTNGEGYSADIGYYEFVNDLSALPSASAFYLDTINVDASDLAFSYSVDIKWDQATSDIDMVVFDSLGAIMTFNTSAANPITSTFTPTSAGVYTLLLIQYSGTTTNEEYWVRKFDTAVRYNVDSLSLIDMQNPRGVGLFKIGSIIPPEVDSDTAMWVNYNNWPSPSYTYWAYNISFTTVPSSPITLNYSLVVYEPNGTTPNERFKLFKDTRDKVMNPISSSKAQVERFKILLEIRIVDNDNLPVSEANVSLINTTTSSISYTALTNSSGWATLDVLRQSYIVKVTINSIFKYVNDTVSVDYSNTQYTTHSDSFPIKFDKIVKISLKAVDNTTKHSYIQNGVLVLRNTSNYSMLGQKTTNLTGWVEFHIHTGSWEFAFNGTGSWDYIALYTDQSLSNLVAGPSYNVTYSISVGTTLYLVDGNITSPPVQTRLILFNTLTHYDVYWNDTITVHVNLTELENKTNIDGTVYWNAISLGSEIVDSGVATQVSVGEFEFTINTVNLPAGFTYTIEIKADPAPISSRKVLKPTPVLISVNVKERPISDDVSFNPGLEVYWNETLHITVNVFDGLDPNIKLSQVTVLVKLVTPSNTISQGPLTETQKGVYEGDLTYFVKNVDSGIYTLIVNISKGNYTTDEKLYNLNILERPTTIEAPTVIETPWVQSYTLSIKYIDSRTDKEIDQASVSFSLVDPKTSNQVDSGSFNYISGSWEATLDLSNIQEGTYSIIVLAGKKNYQNTTKTITLTVRLHLTSASATSTTISTYYKQNVSLNVTYYDIDAKNYISGANVSARIIGATKSGVPITIDLTYVGNGVYSLDFNTTQLNAIGAYTITITLRKKHMETRTIIVTLEVKKIPTIAVADKTADVEIWGENFNITVQYNESLTDKGVVAENYTYQIYSGGKKIKEGNATFVKLGEYIVSFNTSDIGVGSFVIYINLFKTFYESQTVTVTLEVVPVPTISSVSSNNVTIYWNDYTQLVFKYIRTDKLEGVPGATVTYKFEFFENRTMIGKELTTTTNYKGEASIAFHANQTFTPGSYLLTITAIKNNFEASTVQISINIKERPLIAALSSDDVNLVWGDLYNLTLSVTDGITGKALFLKNDEISISENLNDSIEMIFGEGEYIIKINTTKLIAPIQTPATITIAINKAFYEMKTLNFKVKVDPVAIEALLSGPKTVTLNPITGGMTTYKVGIFDKTRGGKPITTASVNLTVSTGAEKFSLEMQNITQELGYYQATIDWTHIPIFNPGESYTISVEFNRITIKGREISRNLLGRLIISEVKGTTSTTVDYFGGSAEVPGIGKVPALLFYPILIVMLITGSVATYKIILYYRTPPEVRELNKLIEQIEKGIYEYEAPVREQLIQVVLSEEL